MLNNGKRSYTALELKEIVLYISTVSNTRLARASMYKIRAHQVQSVEDQTLQTFCPKDLDKLESFVLVRLNKMLHKRPSGCICNCAHAIVEYCRQNPQCTRNTLSITVESFRRVCLEKFISQIDSSKGNYVDFVVQSLEMTPETQQQTSNNVSHYIPKDYQDTGRNLWPRTASNPRKNLKREHYSLQTVKSDEADSHKPHLRTTRNESKCFFAKFKHNLK